METTKSPQISQLVPDFQYSLQTLPQSGSNVSLPKSSRSEINFPQPINVCSQIATSLFLPPASSAIELTKTKQASIAQRSTSTNPIVRPRPQGSSNDKVRKRCSRLARKAELARASRRRKKAYVQDLEEKVAKLTQQVAQLERERAIYGLPPSPALSNCKERASEESSSSDSCESEKDKETDLPSPPLVDGLYGLAGLAALVTASQKIEPSEEIPVKNENVDFEKCEKLSKKSPVALSRTAVSQSVLSQTGLNQSGLNQTLTPTGLTPTGLTPTGLTPTGLTPTGLTPTGLTPSLTSSGLTSSGLTSSGLTQNGFNSFPLDTIVPINFLGLASSPAPLAMTHPPSSPSLFSPSPTSAFAEIRAAVTPSQPEKCIKVVWKGDTRRLRLPGSEFTFPALIQTLRSSYPDLPQQFNIKYYDEEKDAINITTTSELREAHRLATLVSSTCSPSSPGSLRQSLHSPVLKVYLEEVKNNGIAKRKAK